MDMHQKEEYLCMVIILVKWNTKLAACFSLN